MACHIVLMCSFARFEAPTFYLGHLCVEFFGSPCDRVGFPLPRSKSVHVWLFVL